MTSASGVDASGGLPGPGGLHAGARRRNTARGRVAALVRSRAVTVLLALAVVAVASAALIRALPVDHVAPLTQLVAYTPWVAGPALFVAALCAAARRWRLTAVSAACAVAFGLWLAPFYTGYLPGVAVATATEPQLIVLSTNALYGRADAGAIVSLVRERDVDVLVVLELTADLRDRLAAEGLDELLPHHVDAEVGTGAAGSGIWSAGTLSDVDTEDWSGFAMPSATVHTDQGPVRVTAVHPVAPMPGMESRWDAELAGLGDRVGRSGVGVEVYAGDFNASYDHASFRALLGGGFVDATVEQGRGLNTSWSWGGSGLFPVDLDHVVTNAGVLGVESLEVPGSDHRAVLARLALEGG